MQKQTNKKTVTVLKSAKSKLVKKSLSTITIILIV